MDPTTQRYSIPVNDLSLIAGQVTRTICSGGDSVVVSCDISEEGRYGNEYLDKSKIAEIAWYLSRVGIKTKVNAVGLDAAQILIHDFNPELMLQEGLPIQ